jgi:hypothetical protein
VIDVGRQWGRKNHSINRGFDHLDTHGSRDRDLLVDVEFQFARHGAPFLFASFIAVWRIQKGQREADKPEVRVATFCGDVILSTGR